MKLFGKEIKFNDNDIYHTGNRPKASDIAFLDGQSFQDKLDKGLLKGDKGEPGIQGIRGPQGEKGSTGMQGPVGPMGPKGDKGDTGMQGIRGPQGLQGEKGPKGDKGDPGVQGLRGEDGLTTSITIDGRRYNHYNGNIELPSYPTLGSLGAASSSHEHSNYLLKSGGTVNGSLTIDGQLSVNKTLNFDYNNDKILYNSGSNTYEFMSKGEMANSKILAGKADVKQIWCPLHTTIENYLRIAINSKTEDDQYVLEFMDINNYAYLRPSVTNLTRLGSSNYRWNILYSYNAVNVSSDRELKENIKYIKDKKINPLADINKEIDLKDLYDFVKNDLSLATYNLRQNEDKDDVKLGFIAQDMIYTSTGEDSKVGQLIVNNVKKAVKENERLSYDSGTYMNVLAGALKYVIEKIEKMEKDNLTRKK